MVPLDHFSKLLRIKREKQTVDEKYRGLSRTYRLKTHLIGSEVNGTEAGAQPRTQGTIILASQSKRHYEIAGTDKVDAYLDRNRLSCHIEVLEISILNTTFKFIFHCRRQDLISRVHRRYEIPRGAAYRLTLEK